MTVLGGERSEPGLSGDDREKFRGVFEAHRDAVYRFLYRLTRNRHDAEDLLQETFTRYWRKSDQFRGDGSLAGYLRRIAYRTFLNARNRLARAREGAPLEHVEPAAPVDDPAEQAAREDLEQFLLRRVREEVDRLPDSWREPFLLFRYEGLSMKEIAESLDLTPKAVELRVARALKRISERLRELRAEYSGALDL